MTSGERFRAEKSLAALSQQPPGAVEEQRKEQYDELWIRRDVRLDGRRDMDLDGDRRTGGSLAGRRDYQAAQEIVLRSRPACVRSLLLPEAESGPNVGNEGAGRKRRVCFN